jgi:glycerol-3-phosphate acyltransferase PlsX
MSPINHRLPIVVDAMGGDGGVVTAIEAALQAHQQKLGPILLCGNQSTIEAHCESPLPEGIQILHADEFIGMSESPGRAARAKTKSSMHVGMQAIKEGQACAFITAGNSGAALAVGLVVLKRIEGCERPAIASLMPSSKNPVVLLDMGANVECKANHLAQFAVLGTTYAQHVLKIKRPKVGLLSNGQESNKGTQTIREAHRMLNQMDLNYVGYREANHLPLGSCDVLVTDGFVGNVMLKLSEGIVEALWDRLRDQLQTKWLSRVLGSLILKKSLQSLKGKLDWRKIGGAPILGLKGTVIISHGKADAEALCQSIKRAREYASIDLLAYLRDAIDNTPFSGKVSSTSEIPIIQVLNEMQTENEAD